MTGISDSASSTLAASLRNTIQHGDALELLPTLPRESVHLTFFSPPYDGIRDYGKNWTLDYQTLGSQLFDCTVDGM